MESRRDVLAQFRGLRLYYCEDFEYYDEHDTEIRHYCDSTIDRYVGSAGIEDDGVIEACWSRLYEICMSAKLLHREQRYSVMVLQYVEGEYPRRFVEHF